MNPALLVLGGAGLALAGAFSLLTNGKKSTKKEAEGHANSVPTENESKNEKSDSTNRNSDDGGSVGGDDAGQIE